ncbi:collagen alpha-1(XII) chain-like [Haliotis rufescens]|uniref:collagen alpha-1(XII) chain-like n=1 Tax=Haliotis rufescens TaxID=6454 RepID=UPI001EB04FAF|nr:collagen alpha-1(XII) chain-like [Haliotis rufescens]
MIGHCLALLLAFVAATVADPQYIVGSKCPDKPADIVFVLDGSGSQGQANFGKELDFVSNFTKNFNIGPSTVQISVVQFATSVRNEFSLKDGHSSTTLINSISNIKWLNGETYTGDALNYVNRNSFQKVNGGRDHVAKVVIVLTDGGSNHPNETAIAAKRLHDNHINVVAIGIGSEVNKDELNTIASNSKHVFTVPNFDALHTIHNDITDTTCKLCDSTPMDLAFLLDGSGSEGNKDFGYQKNFAKLVVGELHIGDNATRVAMVTFSTGANKNFDFKDGRSPNTVNHNIDRVHYPNGESYTHLGLQYLHDHTFAQRESRYGTKHIAVVLTDGRSNEENLTKQQAARLKASGVLVIAVGIGAGVQMTELKNIASGDKYVVTVDEPKDLDKIHDKVVDLLCASHNVFRTTIMTTTSTTALPTTTTPEPRKVCGPRPADILFLLDSSDSEGADNFAKETGFVSNFANRFYIDPQHNQISALTFSNNIQNAFWFNTYKNRHDVTHAINNIKYVGAGTNTADAFKFARSQSFTKNHGSRANATKIAIVITDGRSKDEAATLREATSLKNSGVVVISIGVGFGQDDHELKSMASRSNYVFSVSNFDALKTIQRQVIETTCQDHGAHH